MAASYAAHMSMKMRSHESRLHRSARAAMPIASRRCRSLDERSHALTNAIWSVCDDGGLLRLDHEPLAAGRHHNGGHSDAIASSTDIADCVGLGRKREDVHLGVRISERVAAQDTGEFRAQHVPAQPLALAAVSDDR